MARFSPSESAWYFASIFSRGRMDKAERTSAIALSKCWASGKQRLRTPSIVVPPVFGMWEDQNFWWLGQRLLEYFRTKHRKVALGTLP
jgi:hypothetical protein